MLQWTEATDELREELRQRHPDRVRAARTRTACGPGSARRCATTSRRTPSSPKGVTITAEDIREGLVGILSVFMEEPQFQGQTKDRLNNPEVLSAIDSMVRPALEQWLNENRSVAEAIVGRIILAARAREASRAAQQEVTRKSATSNRLTLPGKLSDCTRFRARRQRALRRRGRLGRRIGQAGARPHAAGDPAAARQGAEHRERVAQQGAREQGAVGPGDGARLRARQELRHLAAALRPVIILADADSDGNHIATLLLTFIYRHMPQLIAARPRLPRAAAALPDRHRQATPTGRSTTPTATGSWRSTDRAGRRRRRSRGSRASAR